MPARLIADPRHGFLRVDPIPSAEEVDKYYRDEFYSRTQTNFVNDSGLENMREEAEYHRRAFSDFFALINEAYIKAGQEMRTLTVADIGCGYGFWLKYLSDFGVKGYGVEPVAEGIEFLKKNGLEGFCLPIEQLASPPEGRKVGLVTMINVLEHLRDPFDILTNIKKYWLEPNGLILLRVPNEFNRFQTAANKIHGLNEWWVVPPQHINYFSADALEKLLHACEFEVIDITATFPLEMFLLMDQVYVGNPVLGKDCHRRRVAFERNLDLANETDFRRVFYRELARLGLGREIIIIAKAKT